MVVKVGINGFGRIGRIFFRAVLDLAAKGDKKAEVVAVNDLAIDANYMKYLLEHDTTHGQLPYQVEVDGDAIKVGHLARFTVVKEGDPTKLPWGKLGVDVVIECTGRFTKKADASKHLEAGAKKVIISAPSEDSPMFVCGVNLESYDSKSMHVVSNASCTTNCLAPLAKIVHDKFGIKQGLMTTVHAMTATQLTVDGPSARDWRGGRAASANVIPSSTGAAKAVGKVIPSLQGKLTGMAFRVPVPNVSVVDLTVELEKPVTKDDIDREVLAAAKGNLKGIVEFVDFAAVSSDFNSTTYSCVYDSTAFVSFDPKTPQSLVKLVAWYDNERGYSTRLLDLLLYMASKF